VVKRASIAALLLSLGLIGGCSSEDAADNLPPRHPVSGTIKFNGRPLSGATVTFSSETTGGPGAFGQTDENGQYVLTTSDPEDGAVAGRYKVAIAKFEAPQAPASSGTGDSYEPPGTVAASAIAKPKAFLPERYASTATSGLSAEVKEEDNTIDFDLKL